jgi:hypothetical protein
LHNVYAYAYNRYIKEKEKKMNEASKNLIKAVKEFNKATKANNNKGTNETFFRLVRARVQLEVAMTHYEYLLNK